MTQDKANDVFMPLNRLMVEEFNKFVKNVVKRDVRVLYIATRKPKCEGAQCTKSVF